MKDAGGIIKGRYSSYRLQEAIGKGGNAVVYRAVDITTNSLVAVKRMTASSSSTLQQWRAEVETLMALKGDDARFVIRYLDHMQSDKSIAIVEEYAPGGSLVKLLGDRHHGLSERDVAFYMYQVTLGLIYIHSHHIVHRDLKGANVLLCDNSHVKLSDFGLAAPCPVREADVDAEQDGMRGSGHHHDSRGNGHGGSGADEGQEAEGLLGSVYWMAPETARGELQTASSDIWSLGCLAVELLTGQPPFYERSPINALYHIADSSDVPLPDAMVYPMSEGCLDFLTACLSRDPAARPTAQQLITRKWFRDFRVLEHFAGSLVLPSSSIVNGNNANSNGAASGGMASPEATTPRGPSMSTATIADALGKSPRSRNVLIPPSASVSPPSGGGSGGGGGGITSSPDAGAASSAPNFSDDIDSWVSDYLFRYTEKQRGAWLKDGNLQRAVQALSVITPTASYNVMRNFSFFAQRQRSRCWETGGEGSLFLAELGRTDLWGYEDLKSRCELQYLASIFHSCCDGQDPHVPQYAPSHPGVLRMLIGNESIGVSRAGEYATECVNALARLLLNPAPGSGGGTGEDAALYSSSSPERVVTPGGAESVRDTAAAAAWRRAARERFVKDGGFLTVRGVLEDVCKKAFLASCVPALGWATLDKLFHILHVVATATHKEGWLYGPVWRDDVAVAGAPAAAAATGGAGSSAAAGGNVSSSGAVTGVGDGAGGSSAGGLASAGAGTGATAAAGLPSGISSGASPSSDGRPSIGAIISPRIAGSSGEDGALDEIAVKASGVAAVPTETWFLALQEVCRNLCPHAVPPFAQLVSLCLQARPAPQYLIAAPVSITGTLLLVLTSGPALCCVPPEEQIKLIKLLPPLQKVSPRAAQCMADGRGSVELLAYMLRQQASQLQGVRGGGGGGGTGTYPLATPSVDLVMATEGLSAALTSLLSLLCEDSRMVAAAATCEVFVETVLRVVYDECTMAIGAGVESGQPLPPLLMPSLKLLDAVMAAPQQLQLPIESTTPHEGLVLRQGVGELLMHLAHSVNRPVDLMKLSRKLTNSG